MNHTKRLLVNNFVINQRAFTIIELIVVVGILGVVIAIAAPKFSEMKSHMSANQDTRELTSILGTLRAEAVRLRSSIRVSFTTTGYSWDINDDGSVDGSRNLSTNSNWLAGAPSSIVFNGLGLVRGIATTQNLSITNGDGTSTLRLNGNGFIER